MKHKYLKLYKLCISKIYINLYQYKYLKLYRAENAVPQNFKAKNIFFHKLISIESGLQ